LSDFTDMDHSSSGMEIITWVGPRSVLHRGALDNLQTSD
jgi:hypothetical protein